MLAAIVIAGATGTIGAATVALTLSFAIGAALPLLSIALAGRRVAERVGAFRRRQREIRTAAGVVTILLALVFNLPAALQRAIPDYRATLQDTVGGDEQLREQLNLGGVVNDQNRELANCTNGAAELQSCCTAPDLTGITGRLNTPDGAAVDLKSLRGKVVLVDFWAYPCINCQRAIPHIVDWYAAYRDAGFEVIGVRTPEYAFEHVPTNAASGAADLGITYPVALDPNYSTWTNYRNRHWPAKYLIDADGKVRHIKFGGRLQHHGNSDPPTTFGGATRRGASHADRADRHHAAAGSHTRDLSRRRQDGQLRRSRGVRRGAGTGTVTVRRDGESKQVKISGPPTLHEIVSDDEVRRGAVEVQLSQGLQAFPFTYG